jgi:hypothetical protein
MASLSLTYANFRRVPRYYVRGVLWAERLDRARFLIGTKKWSRVMRKTLIAVGATVAIGAVARGERAR